MEIKKFINGKGTCEEIILISEKDILCVSMGVIK